MRTLISLVLFAVAAAAGTYTLQAGDTLGAVARDHGVSVSALARANGIADPDRVYAGQVLTIPGGSGRGGGGAASGSRTHVIAPGETLGGIARRYGVSVSALARANGIADVNRIVAGRPLTVPGGPGWVCPVAVVSRFIDDFGAPRGGGRRHEGVDMVAPRGAPVVAVTNGVLVRHDQPRGGRAFYLRGDDGLTYYGAHLDGFAVRDGRVRLGQHIGSVGDSGNAVGGPTHLHFEIINSKGPKNPYPQLVRHCLRS